MKIVIASDHRGFKLKEHLKETLRREGHTILDTGTDSEKSVHYPEYVLKAVKAFKSEKGERGILICGSGLGVCIAANKFRGIRAVTARNAYDAKMGVSHNNANFICLGADVSGNEESREITDIFINTIFEGGRHNRRLEIIKEIEDAGR